MSDPCETGIVIGIRFGYSPVQGCAATPDRLNYSLEDRPIDRSAGC